MSFFKKPTIIEAENYTAKTPQENSWRKRFEQVESWADQDPWDQIEKPSDEELRLCVNELFSAIKMNTEAFRFIEKKCNENGPDSPRLVILETAKTVANVLEGC